MGENSGENSSIVRAFEGAKIDNDVFEVDDKEVLMKRMISEHPLFELLIETHINCLKVGLGEIEEAVATTDSLDEANNSYAGTTNNINPASPELDKFMEAYCMALNKLKEAMEEPLKDATSFITNMYAQLKDLNVTENAEETLIFRNEKD